MIFIFVVIASFILVLYLHVTRNFHYWKKRNVPYLEPMAFFGNFFTICLQKQVIGDFYKRIYDSKRTKYVGFFSFDQPCILIRDPEIIKSLLIKDFQSFTNHAVTHSKDDALTGNMLFFTTNSKWKMLRRYFATAYSSAKLKNMFWTIAERCDEVIRHVDEASENEIDCRDFSVRYGVDAISACGFGIKAHALQKGSAFFKMTERLSAIEFIQATSMAACFVAPILVKVFKLKFLESKAANYFTDIFVSITEKRKKCERVQTGDLIDVLLQLEQHGHNVDENLIGGSGIQFLIAGFETTGATVSYALYELGMNDSVQESLREEIRSVCGGKNQVSYEMINRMEYLDMVLKETLRKYPVLPFLDRRSNASYKVPGSDLVIEKGVNVYISLTGLHYDENFFPNPDKFDPERFTSKQNPWVYMPFGNGPRKCIGGRFAELAVKVILVKLLLNFRVTPSSETPFRITFQKKGFLLTPEGHKLYLNFERIHPKCG